MAITVKHHLKAAIKIFSFCLFMLDLFFFAKYFLVSSLQTFSRDAILCLIKLQNINWYDGRVKVELLLHIANFNIDRHVKVKGITCKKMHWYMHDSRCRWYIIQNAKIFWTYVRHFLNLSLARNTESWLVEANKFFSIPQLYFLTK